MKLSQLIEYYSLQQHSGYHEVKIVPSDAHTDIVTPHQLSIHSRYLHTVSVTTLEDIANRKIQHNKSLCNNMSLSLIKAEHLIAGYGKCLVISKLLNIAF